MDSNGCDVDHMDVDVRLPPRKRLLAGLKRQSFSESSSQCSHENSPSPSLSLSPSVGQSPLSEFDVRLSNLLKSYKNGSKMSPEEIALAAKSAAEAAAKAAQAARVVAEEKAMIASKAVAAAKNALDLVACEEMGSRNKHKRKKNKMKNHVPVEVMYDKNQPIEHCGADEEFARRLHRDMNSSLRISKHSSGSKSENHKHKKLKLPLVNDESGVSNGISVRNGDVKLPNGDAEGGKECVGRSSAEESYTIKVNGKVPEFSKNDEVEVDSGEAESSHPKEKIYDGIDELTTRKRGRIKQKRLPLSICSTKDQANAKEELESTNLLLTSARTDVTPMEVAPTWKCQDFKGPQCMKQDKLVQS